MHAQLKFRVFSASVSKIVTLIYKSIRRPTLKAQSGPSLFNGMIRFNTFGTYKLKFMWRITIALIEINTSFRDSGSPFPGVFWFNVYGESFSVLWKCQPSSIRTGTPVMTNAHMNVNILDWEQYSTSSHNRAWLSWFILLHSSLDLENSKN